MSYTPFKQMEAKLASKPGVTNPGGLAAFIARKSYGNKALETAAKNGTSLRGHKKLKHGPHHKAAAKFVQLHGGGK